MGFRIGRDLLGPQVQSAKAGHEGEIRVIGADRIDRQEPGWGQRPEIRDSYQAGIRKPVSGGERRLELRKSGEVWSRSRSEAAGVAAGQSAWLPSQLPWALSRLK